MLERLVWYERMCYDGAHSTRKGLVKRSCMVRKRKTTEPRIAHEQPYDSSFRALIEDQTLAMLSYFFGEEVLSAKELKESLFKRDVVKPALRVDCLYDMFSRKSANGLLRTYVGHLEIETAPAADIGRRMLDYRSGLHRKHERPIRQVLVCPFETSYLPTAPYRMEHDEDKELLVESRYRVVALWQEEASELLAARRVELYALLPTMKGATYEVLAQGLQAMKAFYPESRLCMHWLWFGTLLDRTTTVSQQDKERIRIEMSESESLLDSNPFVRERVAKGEARGRAEGEAKGLQEALIVAVELRFPTLLDLAQERAKRVKQPDTLRLALHGIKTASNEEIARTFLEMLAA